MALTGTTSSRQFSRTRLQLARSFAEVTQAELAARVGVGQPFIGLIETGRKEPSDGLVDAIADALGFSKGFFFEAGSDEFRADDWSFRRFQNASAASINRLLAHGTLFCLLVGYFDATLRLPGDNIPTVKRPKNREEIERAAELCRMQLGVGLDVPIKNVTRAFELAGVMIATVGSTGGRIDAVSRAVGHRGVILLSDDKCSTSRRLFDLCHEGGHLVMHVGTETGTHETEEEANAFASAMLLPRRAFIRELPRPPRGYWTRTYWRQLFDMKKRWRASVAAIVRRAFDLNMIGAAEYQRAYKFMSSQGWLRNGEPAATEPEPEQLSLLPNAFATLKSRRGITARDVASALHWAPSTLEKVSGIAIQDEEPQPEVPTAQIVAIDFARAKRPVS